MSKRDIQAGRASIAVSLNDKGVKGQLSRLSRRLRGFGTSLLKIGGSLAAGSVVALAPLVKLAATAEETNSKFQAVFGEMTAATEAWAKGFASDVGRSENEVKKFLAGTQDLLVPLGFEPGAAKGMSQEISRLAVDLASFNNLSDADALNDLQAALTGSGEVMKKYGVIVSEAAVKQRLLQEGVDPKGATEQQKTYARWQIILAGTTAAQGDAIRTAGSFTNQMKRLRSQVIDLATGLGSHLLPVLTPVISFIGDAVSFVKDWADANPGLARTIMLVAAGAGTAGAILAVLGVAIIGVGAAVSGAITIFGALSAVFAAIGPFLLPIIAGVAAVAAVLALVVGPAIAAMHATGGLMDIWEKLSKAASQTFRAVTAAIREGKWREAIQILWAGAKVAFWGGLDALYEGTKRALPKLLSIWKDLFKGIVDAAKFGMKAVWKIMTTPLLSGTFVDDMKNAMNDISLSGEDRFLNVQYERAQAELDRLTAQFSYDTEVAQGGSGAPGQYDHAAAVQNMHAALDTSGATTTAASAFAAIRLGGSDPVKGLERQQLAATERVAEGVHAMARQLGKLRAPAFGRG